MDWTEINIEVSPADVEQAAAIAQMTAEGVYIEDYTDLEQQVLEISRIDLIDEELLEKDRSKAILHIYIDPTRSPAEPISFLQNRLEFENIPYKISSANVKEEDWATAWQKYYHPFRVGNHIMVCPEWESCQLEDEDILLKLNPGMAFGTGTHETTCLCLELLEKYIFEGASTLDIGCGSGILSIVSVLLGGKTAIGVDIDQLAVKTAKDNAQLNQSQLQTEFICGDLTEKVSGKYDIICANIVADIIIRLSETVSGFLSEGSILICSGIIDSREQEVIDSLIAAGFEIKDIKRKNGWTAISCGTKL